MAILTLAFRNLCRQRVRTAIAISAIFFGVLALLLSGGFVEWIFWAMREATVHSKLGHIQIAKKGFFSQGQHEPSQFILPNDSQELSQIEGTPRVRLTTTRLTFNGLASRGETTT